jgi:NAD(P)H-hydrate epimerase
MKILTSEQMRGIDRLTVGRCLIPYPILMENAGARTVEAIITKYGSVAGRHCAVFCGKGNNGGDGAVIARLLWMKGAAEVEVFLLGKIEETKGEARTNFEIIKKLAEEEKARGNILELTFREVAGEDEELGAGYDLVIDAIFGTGLARPAEGLSARAIDTINLIRLAEEAKVISVDIPSGLPSDSPEPIGPYVEADLTVALTSPKIGNALPPACYANGDLVIGGIGTPPWLIDEESGSKLDLIEEQYVSWWLRDSRRAPDAHKGSVGDVLIIAGSRGKTGAAALSSESALRAGTGLVTVATARSAQGLLISQARTEVMTEALDEIESGAISHTAVDRAMALSEKRTVVAIGPGLSSNDESTRRFVSEFAAKRRTPLVIDADGLNSLAPWPDDLKGSDLLPIIITPHPGEMARLTGLTNSEITGDRIGIAREFALKHGVITILKGSRTIIASPDGMVYVNPTGNAGMATAGSGDVLTGMIAGLIAQNPLDPLGAAISAVYLHGLAGDIAAARLGQRSLLASDITGFISTAIIEAGGDQEKCSNPGISKI